MTTFINVKKEDVKKIFKNFKEVAPKADSEDVRWQGPCTAILYKSKKLLLQGKNTEEVKNMLINQGFKMNEIKDEKGIIIGSDESLKGDTFGGLIVVAVRADDKQRKELTKIGVMDSKLIADDKINTLANQIKKISPYAIRNLFPEEYNKHTQTNLMNMLHFEVGNELKVEDSSHVVDLFPGCSVGDIAVTKAESKYIEVAAASIIARQEGLLQLAALSKMLDYPVPKGSAHVSEALKELKMSKKEPSLFVKLHFGNVKKVFF